MVLLPTLQSFSQNIDSVWVEVINGDTLVVMTPSKARFLASNLIDKDSCIDKNSYLEEKIKNQENIIKGDKKQITSLNKDINLVENQLKKEVEKGNIVKEQLSLEKETSKKFKLQKHTWGFAGILIGLVTGVILSL